jgi:hypothetical protein
MPIFIIPFIVASPLKSKGFKPFGESMLDPDML